MIILRCRTCGTRPLTPWQRLPKVSKGDDHYRISLSPRLGSNHPPRGGTWSTSKPPACALVLSYYGQCTTRQEIEIFNGGTRTALSVRGRAVRSQSGAKPLYQQRVLAGPTSSRFVAEDGARALHLNLIMNSENFSTRVV